MNLNITGKDFDLTDSIKNYIDEKVAKLVKYFGDEFDATATLKIEGNKQVAEIRVSINGELYKAVTASHDLYSSIDKDIEILEGQIRKNKTKKDKQNMTESIRLKESNANFEGEKEVKGEIVKTLFYEIKPVTPEDAKLILEDMPKNQFLAFANVETGKVNVIYRLKDGKNFGLVEPEA